MNPENLTLSETHQTINDKYYRIHLRGTYRSQIHRDTGGCEGEKRELLSDGHRVSVLQDEQSSEDGRCWWLPNNTNVLISTGESRESG